MTKILWFVLFLLVYGLYITVQYFLSRRFSKSRGSALWVQELMALSFSVVLYLFVLLLSRFSTIVIALGYFVSAQIGFLLSGVLGSFMGDPRRQYKEELGWASISFSIRYNWIPITQVVLSLIITVAYPIVSGIVYFRSTIPSDSATLQVIRLTLLFLFVSGIVLISANQIAVFTSENLSNATRRRYLSNTIGALVPLGMLLAVLFWATGVSSEGAIGYRAGNVELTLAPILMIILIVFFLSTSLLPSIIGQQRSSKWQAQLRQGRRDYLTEAINILRAPTSASYKPRLTELRAQLVNEGWAFIVKDNAIILGLAIDESLEEDATESADDYGLQIESEPKSPQIGNGMFYDSEKENGEQDEETGHPWSLSMLDESRRDFIEAFLESAEDTIAYYKVARNADPRFQFIDWLHDLWERLRLVEKELMSRRAGSGRINAARTWAVSFDEERDDLKESVPVAKGNDAVAVIYSTIATSILGVFFTGFGNWIWSRVYTALPK